MTEGHLLTLGEAARRLGLTAQRVTQLLQEDILEGPGLPPGRLRHPPGAGRVTAQSVDDLIRARGSTTGLGARRRAISTDSRLASARLAVLEMKVQLDVAREALAAEREIQAGLLRTIESLAVEQQAVLENATRLNQIAESYSSALSHFMQISPKDVQTRS